jgi:hypothetical protein
MPGAPEAGPYQIAQQQAGAFLQLALAEQLQAARPDCLLAIGGAPCLAIPACANAYAPPVAISTRQFNTLLYELFGAEPWISTGESTLSQLVLSTTGHARGFALPRSLAQFSGFEAVSANLDGLRGSGGDMFIIHNVPPQSAYTSMGERPAVATEQIATLPGDWNGTRAVWICFEGTGGSVSVDAYNKATVTWPGGSWSRTLPGGIWKIEHPDPAQVKPGDVVLIKFSPLKAPLSQGSNAG